MTTRSRDLGADRASPPPVWPSWAPIEPDADIGRLAGEP
jgi:hypothetical protein